MFSFILDIVDKSFTINLDVCCVGTLYHRTVECLASASTRREYEHQDVINRASLVGHSSEPLCQDAVPTRFEHMAPTPSFVSRWAGGRDPGCDFTFSGNCFTAGSMTGRAPSFARRAGWAAITVDANGLVGTGRYGTCPEKFPSVFRA